MGLLISYLLQLRVIHKLHLFPVHADVVQQGAHVSVRSLVQVAHHRVCPLRIVLNSRVSANLLISLDAEDVLMAKHIFDFAFVNRHAAGVRVVHGLSLVAVAVLERMVLYLRQFSELLQIRPVERIVQEALLLGPTLQHVDKSALLLGSETGEHRH